MIRNVNIRRLCSPDLNVMDLNAILLFLINHWKFRINDLKCSYRTHMKSMKDPVFNKRSAAAAKSLQLCPTLCNLIDGSPPGSPVPGILQEEYWSGLPFPSPMHESEKWKWSCSVLSHSSRPHGLQPTRHFRPWDFPGKSTGVGAIAFSAIRGHIYFISSFISFPELTHWEFLDRQNVV